MSELITTLTLIFAASSIMLLLLDKYSHPAIPAYILAGIAIGFLVDENQILGFSQLGIAFLVFIFGLNTEPERIESVAQESLSTALIQITVVGAAAYIIAQGIGLDALNTIYLISAASLSSSLVGLELAEDEIRIDLLHGRLSESIHLVQDLIAVLIVLIATKPSFLPSEIGLQLISGFALLIGALVFRTSIYPVIADRIRESTELIMLTGLALLTGFISLSNLLNISIVVGAFSAGIAAARFPYNLDLLENMSSLKDFFSAIFFVTLGALLSIPSPLSLLLTFFLLASTLILKPGITVISLLINGYDQRTAYLTSLTLDQISEFALILAIQGLITGKIINPLFNAIILAATITMITSSYSSRHEEKIYSFISNINLLETTDHKIKEWTNTENLENHVLLIGYDTQGKRIAEALENEHQDFVIIENDPEKIIEAKKKEENYIFGDVMDPKTWEKANTEESKLIISTIPQKKVSNRILKLEKPEDKILRAEEPKEAAELMKNGALYVEVPDIVAAEELIDHIRGVMENENYSEELRRKNLLELRKYLNTKDELSGSRGHSRDNGQSTQK